MSVGGFSDSEQFEFLEMLVEEAAKTGTKVIVGGEEVTPADIEAIKADACQPADPPDASIGWPDNAACHDQAAAALSEWLTNLDGDYSVPEDDPLGTRLINTEIRQDHTDQMRLRCRAGLSMASGGADGRQEALGDRIDSGLSATGQGGITCSIRGDALPAPLPRRSRRLLSST